MVKIMVMACKWMPVVNWSKESIKSINTKGHLLFSVNYFDDHLFYFVPLLFGNKWYQIIFIIIYKLEDKMRNTMSHISRHFLNRVCILLYCRARMGYIIKIRYTFQGNVVTKRCLFVKKSFQSISLLMVMTMGSR